MYAYAINIIIARAGSNIAYRYIFLNNNMAAKLKKSHLMVVLIVIRRQCLDAAANADVSQGPH